MPTLIEDPGITGVGPGGVPPGPVPGGCPPPPVVGGPPPGEGPVPPGPSGPLSIAPVQPAAANAPDAARASASAHRRVLVFRKLVTRVIRALQATRRGKSCPIPLRIARAPS